MKREKGVQGARNAIWRGRAFFPSPSKRHACCEKNKKKLATQRAPTRRNSPPPARCVEVQRALKLTSSGSRRPEGNQRRASPRAGGGGDGRDWDRVFSPSRERAMFLEVAIAVSSVLRPRFRAEDEPFAAALYHERERAEAKGD